MRIKLLLSLLIVVAPVLAENDNFSALKLNFQESLEQQASYKVSLLNQEKEVIEYLWLSPFQVWDCGLGDYVKPDLTPDQQIKFNYERGFVKIIADFSATNHILSYTPIRQLVEAQERPAVFEGHYYVSE